MEPGQLGYAVNRLQEIDKDSQPQDSSKSVCIIVENLSVPFDRRVWNEARALHGAGYRVSVISPKAPGATSGHEVLSGIDIYRHWTWNASGRLGYIFEYAWSLAAEFALALRVYARSRFQVLQACNPPDTIFLIALFFKLFGVRFVFDHHDLGPELYQARFGGQGLAYRLMGLAERLTFRTADFSFATNESYREIAVSRGGMDPARVCVVRNCPDLSEIAQVKPRPELKRGRPYLVVYVGIMSPQDGVDLLLQSIDYLRNQMRRQDIFFILVGSGSELPRLQRMAAKFSLEECVEFTGLIPHDEVASYIATADVCVAPDPGNPLNSLSTMIKWFEYMAHGRPAVLYDLKEGRRTVGDAALYARDGDPHDFAQQILKLLDSDSLRQELGARGRQRVLESLNWQNESRNLLEAYGTLFSERDPQARKVHQHRPALLETSGKGRRRAG